MKKVLVTLVGKDTVGIIAKVCTFFSENNINILDISQTTVDEFINMMMIVDVSKYKGTFADLSDSLNEVAKDVNCVINAQRTEIFTMMHKV